MITQILTVLDAAAEALPVGARYRWASIVAGRPHVHVGNGDFVPVADDAAGSWSYWRALGPAQVSQADIGEACIGYRVTMPLRFVAWVDREECTPAIMEAVNAIRASRRDVVAAIGASDVQFERIAWQVDGVGGQEFRPEPVWPMHKMLVNIDITLVVEADERCVQGCGDSVSVLCRLMGAANLEEIRDCLGERINELCDLDCLPATYSVNGTPGTPIPSGGNAVLQVLQGGVQVGTFDPATGVHTVDPCPEPEPCPIEVQVRNTDDVLVRSEIVSDPCQQEGPVVIVAPDGTVTFDGETLITVPSDGVRDITCNTLVHAAYVQDGGSRTGTYKVDGTVNGKDRYRLDGSHALEYTGTRWRGVFPGPDVDAATGNEDNPWQADWSGAGITVTQASIAQYCDQCDPPTLCEQIAEATVESIVGCLDDAEKDKEVLCDLLGQVLPADAQDEILDCVTAATWTAIRIAQVCDLDAQAYLARVEAADGDYLEQAYRDAVCDLVLGLKADGLWSALADFVPLIGARTLAGALVPLKGATPINIGFVSGDYVRKQGLKGDGTAKYLNTRRNINEFPQNDIHASVYVHTSQTSGAAGAYIGGGGTSTNGAIGINRALGGDLNNRNRNTTNNTVAPNATGFMGHSRDNGSNYTSRVASTNQTITQASQAPGSIEIYAFAQSLISGGVPPVPNPVTFTDGRIACYTIGTSLTLAALQSRVDAFIAAVNSTIP